LPDADRFALPLKQELMSELSECDVDVALQRETLTRRSKRLVVFDMDSTLIPIEVIDEMAKLHGVGEQVSHITEEAMHGRFDFRESLRQRVALLKGLKHSQVVELSKNLPLNDGAQDLMRVLKGLGYKVGIISGGFDIAADHLRKRLGLDFAYANKLEIIDGVLSGRVHDPIVDASMKAQLLTEIALRENIPLEQTIAIGDGANDALMLAKAGLGIAFHAKPQLKKMAATSVSSGGLERILYLLGMSAQDVEEFLLNCPS
jgi:phosphoserine phosphatase